MGEPQDEALGRRERKAALVADSKGPDQTFAMKGRPGDGAAVARPMNAVAGIVLRTLIVNAMRGQLAFMREFQAPIMQLR